MDASGGRGQRIREIEGRLSELEGERKRLVVELTSLQSSSRSPDELPAIMGLPAWPNKPQTPEEKVELFLSLFRARESVFPKLWENSSKGTKGYTVSMFRKRLIAYRKMEYQIEAEVGSRANRMSRGQPNFFSASLWPTSPPTK